MARRWQDDQHWAEIRDRRRQDRDLAEDEERHYPAELAEAIRLLETLLERLDREHPAWSHNRHLRGLTTALHRTGIALAKAETRESDTVGGDA